MREQHEVGPQLDDVRHHFPDSASADVTGPRYNHVLTE